MIAIDTSALMAIVLGEPLADACAAAAEEADHLVISASTLAEALIVAGQRGVLARMERLVDDLDLEVLTVNVQAARRVAEAYRRWGKGVHPAGLNLGDCFAYEAAARQGCPLLFIGGDFAKTDLTQALAD